MITNTKKTILNIGGKRIINTHITNAISIRVGRILPVKKKLNELRAPVPLAILRVTPHVA
jgi:hypothetical protein